MANRHGLVAGATGTGKTRTLQLLAEQLSAAGVPSLVADVKGDLSGLAQPGDPASKAAERAKELGLAWTPTGFPVEYLALGGLGAGVPVRATVSDFGPSLLAKVLGANETQEQSLQLVFHYADTHGLALVDLADLRALLTFLSSDAGKAELEGIGGLSSATVGVLLRNLVGLETGGGTEFFGEPQFAIADLAAHRARRPRGHLVPGAPGRAGQARPLLHGAHVAAGRALRGAARGRRPAEAQARVLLRRGAPALHRRDRRVRRRGRPDRAPHPLQGRRRLLRHPDPEGRPGDVLGQLGMRVQHALRAFTPDDAKALKATVSTFPRSDFYDLEELLPSLGIGEAAVTVLDERGVPTPVVHTRLAAPQASMGPAPDVAAAAQASPLWARYGTRLEGESAREVLAARMTKAAPADAPPTAPVPDHVPAPGPNGPPSPPGARRSPSPRSTRSGTSWAPGRASSCRSRSCAGSSACCGRSL